jgi:formylglycine-generating enzyme required for sulfatase activity
MANTSALGLALATAAALISTSGVVEAPAGEGDHATAPSRQISGGSSAPEAKTTGRVFVDCSDGCPQMVEIPSGRFLMGSKLYEREQPLHPVSLDMAIAVGRFETTFDEWDACVRGGGCVHNSTPSDEGWGRGRRPVIDVSWNDAKDYVSWLSRKTGKPYRLLSEAEWEYAARAGSTTTYSWGDEIDCGKASYDGGRGSDCAAHTGRSSLRGTQLVGKYTANRWGLYDMLGNVWEWCEDNWHPDYHGAPEDGSAWRGGDASMRILRGGAWNYGPSALRSADRNWFPRDGRTSFMGFRVARQPDSRPEIKVSGLVGSEEELFK